VQGLFAPLDQGSVNAPPPLEHRDPGVGWSPFLVGYGVLRHFVAGHFVFLTECQATSCDILSRDNLGSRQSFKQQASSNKLRQLCKCKNLKNTDKITYKQKRKKNENK